MIKTGILIFVAATLAFAQNARTESSQSIPAAAAQIGTNLYRYTDASGKIWLYSRTPFGISKREDKPATQRAIPAPPVTTTDLGDSIRFEVQTPFGVTRWVSKKTDLTDSEQLMLLRDQLRNQSTPEKTAPSAAQETK